MTFQVFDNLVSAVWVVNDDGQTIYCNEAASQLLDLSSRRMVGKKIADLFGHQSAIFKQFSEGKREEISVAIGSVSKMLQVYVRKFSETESSWVFFIHDTTLEASLHKKYKAELQVKELTLERLEIYKNNLEKFIIFLLAAISGFQFLATQQIIAHAPPVFVSGIRFLGAGVVLIIPFWSQVRAHLNLKSLGALIIPTVIYRVLGFGGFTWSLKYVPSGVAGVFFATSTLWIYLFRIYRGAEKPELRSFVGVLVGLLGICFLLSKSFGTSASIFGYLVMLVSVALFSIGMVMRPNKDPFFMIVVELIIAGIFLLVASPFFEDISSIDIRSFPKEAMLGIIYVFVFATVISEPAYAWLFGTTSSIKAGSVAFIRPVIALFAGWFIASEELTFQALLGTALIFASLFFLMYKKKKQK